MTYVVTITSQGQISVPAPIRKKYKMNQNRQVLIREEPDGRIIFEPMQDLLSLQGAFKTSKRLTRKQENEAFARGMASRHVK